MVHSLKQHMDSKIDTVRHSPLKKVKIINDKPNNPKKKKKNNNVYREKITTKLIATIKDSARAS